MVQEGKFHIRQVAEEGHVSLMQFQVQIQPRQTLAPLSEVRRSSLEANWHKLLSLISNEDSKSHGLRSSVSNRCGQVTNRSSSVTIQVTCDKASVCQGQDKVKINSLQSSEQSLRARSWQIFWLRQVCTTFKSCRGKLGAESCSPSLVLEEPPQASTWNPQHKHKEQASGGMHSETASPVTSESQAHCNSTHFRFRAV